MKYLENINDLSKQIPFQIEKYLNVDIDFEGFSAMVYGKTETALRWAEKFLKHGLTVAIQFQEIPERLKPYRINIKHIGDDFQSGDNLNKVFIAAIATGNPELDQILATDCHCQEIRFIMSETQCRYSNIKFPEDKQIISKTTKIEKN